MIKLPVIGEVPQEESDSIQQAASREFVSGIIPEDGGSAESDTVLTIAKEEVPQQEYSNGDHSISSLIGTEELEPKTKTELLDKTDKITSLASLEEKEALKGFAAHGSK
ncbi:hypothetical protein GYA37_02735 [candidate division WWE3 bacterium]|uniref:Uncharacterized protein n=1 Tax=candidate division WWE3 bacterium TaxID=2053526 RepID=A0A7X9E7J0_UNCKA|nr:hypothetical protein [candidate division WWE3 bacterium]